ncbi:MAG: pyruvate:ferredoxin (flavodoxin) oxidoreductase [Oscillospiraceae bacterium]|nr:pyruvate:ferredoxin (flavodoxin) oxidoreductase [Oscillospiraceae bacterium]
MNRTRKTMDGNTAAAHVAYAFTEVAAIFPITPSSVMAELADKWAAAGRKNIFGQPVRVAEMQSEAGVAGAVHGSLTAGALTTTFTASQGLLLMIPNMYKIAGGLLPNVIHVSARALATHALSIFGDHSDIMACRGTGYAMLCSNNPQEAMDLGAVAHLAAIRGRVPFVHFFDGFRTSHEMQKVEAWEYEDLAEMVDMDAVREFRARALNPNHPVLRGSNQNPDIFFQVREAANPYYDAIPGIVEGCMKQVNDKLGTNYQLFNYYGAPDAETVLVAMGSVCETAEETIDYMMSRGEKVGLVKARLFRPFVTERFLSALPATVKSIVVMDRSKDPVAMGEPLYQDVVTALSLSGRGDIKVCGGRYGLGSKDTTPGCVLAAFRNGQSATPKNGFTVGIEDDVTGHSLPITEEPDTIPQGTVSCKFWGLGSDGTVGANKNSIKIIGDHTDMNVQAYFQYDSKKSGGVTISHLRFGEKPIQSTYFVSKADFVACHNPSYVEKYEIVQDVKPGGTFLLNCAWDADEMGAHLPAGAKRYLAQNNIKVYTCDAISEARKLGLGNRTNTILQAAFFKLSELIPIDDVITFMKDAAAATYARKGEKIVKMNQAAIDVGVRAIREISVPAGWANASDVKAAHEIETVRPELKEFVENIMVPMDAQRGDKLPVSALAKGVDGTLPVGTSAFEKRGIAVDVPKWIPENCIQCGQCSLVCPHAVIRPYALTKEELSAAPEGAKSAPMKGKGCEDYAFMISVSPYDCTGCGSCANICPAKEKALVMEPLESQKTQNGVFLYALEHVAEKKLPFAAETVKGSQFRTPLLEFSGACAGCGETPYVKLATQLFGDRMMIANATGCSSIWGAAAPSTPYTINKEGKGPAWENSLFEDNAEFGYGMNLAMEQRRAKAVELAETVAACANAPESLTSAAKAWLSGREDSQQSAAAGKMLMKELKAALEETASGCTDKPYVSALYEMGDVLTKPSVWIFGGDGWAYDIGYGGLDHVIASGENVNILVLDTEVYSNTGGQASKASQTAQVALFAASGKTTKKKDLAQMAMAYGYVYVAQIAMGANYQQTVRALAEAEAYPGPSLVIAYAPCINHGIKTGMVKGMDEMKAAVDAGYWHLFRYDPRLEAQGKNPFQLDSKKPTENYQNVLGGEVRYSSLALAFPERAKKLFAKAEKDAADKYDKLVSLTKLYDK